MPQVELTAVNIERGNCFKIKLPGSKSCIVIDNGRFPREQEFAHGVVPWPHLGSAEVPEETTVYHRLKPYFEHESVISQFLSHCHLDHNGGFRALWWLCQELGIELKPYSSLFTFCVASRRDFCQLQDGDSEIVEVGYYQRDIPILAADGMRVTAHHVCHSTPVSHIFEIETPIGLIVWLLDFTFTRHELPLTQQPQHEYTESLLSLIGQKRPEIAVVESLYAHRENGFTPSETLVTDTFGKILTRAQAEGRRVVTAFFGSNADRTSNLMCAADDLGLKTTLLGAPQLYYLAAQEAHVDLESFRRRLDIHTHVKDADLIIASGCQAEEFSVLMRTVNPPVWAQNRSPLLELGPDDIVVLSAVPIPGNEKVVADMITKVLATGAEVVLPVEIQHYRQFQFPDYICQGRLSYERTHVSGHEGWPGIKHALELLQPEIVIPYHGGLRQRTALAERVNEELPEAEIMMFEEGETKVIFA